MAATRPTQQDIDKYKEKMIGPLTKRQTICCAIGIVPTGILAFTLNDAHVDTLTILLVSFVIMGICFLLGTVEPYGMSPREFVRDFYYYNYICSPKRLYIRETFDDTLEKQKRKEELKNGTIKKTRQAKTKISYKPDPDYPEFK